VDYLHSFAMSRPALKPAANSPTSATRSRTAGPSGCGTGEGGTRIIKLNIGNPGPSAFAPPETMRQAMIENLRESDAYCHQKGIFPAREAVVMQQQTAA